MIFDFLKRNKPSIEFIGLDDFLDSENIQEKDKLPILLKVLDDCGELEEFKEFIKNSEKCEHTEDVLKYIEKVQQCNQLSKLIEGGIINNQQAHWTLAKEFLEKIISNYTGGEVTIIDDFLIKIVLPYDLAFNFNTTGINKALDKSGMFVENLCIKNYAFFDDVIVHLKLGCNDDIIFKNE